MSILVGKTVIVSGGATLIGIKIAEAAAAAGAKVMIADINETDGAATATSNPEQIAFLKTDVTDDGSIDACLNETVARFGGIDCLVNVACTYLDEGIASTREQWHTALDVNLVGGAIFTQKAAPHMQRRGGGAVVNFGSISGKCAQPGRMLYAVSKAAILGMTRNQALALAPDKIRVNSVSPGWTWSNVIRDFSGNDRAKADAVAAPFHLNQRLVDAEEVANAVVFLCSAQAGGITGSDIAVDSGYTAIGPEQQIDQVSSLAE